MTANSFRRGLETIPPQYRTPSPPLLDFEPLSPGTAAWSETWSQPLQRAAGRARLNEDAWDTNGHVVEPYALADEQSSMSNFASIALAADAQAQQPPMAVALEDSHQSAFEERPSKRARNKRMAEPHWHNEKSGLGTDELLHESDTRRLEAELLLNFSREACNKARSYSMSSTSAHRYDGLMPSLLVEQSPLASSGDPFSHDAYADGLHRGSDHNRIAQKRMPLKVENRKSNGPSSHSGSQASDRLTPIEVAPSAPAIDPPQPSKVESPEDDKSVALPNQSDSHNQTATSASADLPIEEEASADLQDGTTTASAQRLDGKTESRFLDGLEEAAEADLSLPVGSVAIVEDVAQVVKSTLAKQKSSETPSICAACNFTPNALTAETENDSTSWICCDGCKSWFHFACAGFKNEREVRSVDKFRCRKCKPVHGSTTYVRKSARAHSAIDYAGLNEGIVKSSDENPEHHYIKPIKEGTIKFDPENFARMRPELVTADYFEKGDGMREPIVVPAEFNPRPRHVPDNDDLAVTTTDDAGELHDTSVLNTWLSEGFQYEQVPDCGQDSLGMVIPLDLTVRKVSELYGPDEKIEVIDVKSQNGEDKKWNMKRWVDYYEAQGTKPVRNVISLEVSQSKLGRLIRRPHVVRDLDLQDSVWPSDLIAKGDYPKVQFYCLMSVADCFTDFHIDFGGSSVYYHILKGKKTFFFIPPHEKHLKKYEEWCNSPAQNWTFLGDQTKECYRVDLFEGDTMLIPAGWIHAVWTPEDSLVIGGNFLTRLHYAMQIRVTQIEKATHVARKFRYPCFQKVMWYAASKYLETDPLPDLARDALAQGQKFHRDFPTYLDFDGFGENSAPGPENFHTRYYSRAELDGLPELVRFIQRTALIAAGSIIDGISAEARNAVRRSIPKACGEPFELAKRFAIWVAWKRGNENIPHWAYPGYIPENTGAEAAEKKMSAKTLKKLDRDAAIQAWRIAPDRQSTRPRTQPQNFLAEISGQSPSGQSTKSSTPAPQSESSSNALKRKAEYTPSKATVSEGSSNSAKKPRTSSGQKPSMGRRPACEACRKGRRACKHRDDPPPQVNGVLVTQNEVPAESTSTTIQTNITLSTVPNESALSNGNTEIQIVNNVQHNNVDHEPDSQPGPHVPEFHLTKMGGPTPGVEVNLTPSKSSGRSKACKDCRKSKRRCVHDEFGNEDPAKLEQAVIPRPAAKKKRPSAEGAEVSSSKKSKKPSDSTTEIDTAVILESSHLTEAPEAFETSGLVQTDEVGDSVAQTEFQEDITHESQQPVIESVIDPRLEAMTIVAGMPQTGAIAADDHATFESEQDFQSSTQPTNFNLEDEVNLIATSPMSEVKVEHQPEQGRLASSSNLSHQVTSSLVSPPASTHTDAEQTPPAPTRSGGFTPPATSNSSRHSSRPAKNSQRFTPESGPVRRESASSTGQAIRESASPAASLGQTPMHKRTKSRVNSQSDADEESLRLIRELQAQDMGLRRRGKGS